MKLANCANVSTAATGANCTEQPMPPSAASAYTMTRNAKASVFRKAKDTELAMCVSRPYAATWDIHAKLHISCAANCGYTATKEKSVGETCPLLCSTAVDEAIPINTKKSTANTSSVRPSADEDSNLQLPAYMEMSTPCFTWRSHNARLFTDILEVTYCEVIHWRTNCFPVRVGKLGNNFVQELSRLSQAFGAAYALESIALKAVMVFPVLLLQKPYKTSKAKDHINCLERRLVAWKGGHLNDLLMEGRTLQQRLPKRRPSKDKGKLAQTFANLMFAGKCKAALDMDDRSILYLDDPSVPTHPNSPIVRDVLISKHLPGQKVHSGSIIPIEPDDPHQVTCIFDSIDGNVIRSAALRVTGSAGPSGMDARLEAIVH